MARADLHPTYRSRFNFQRQRANHERGIKFDLEADSDSYLASGDLQIPYIVCIPFLCAFRWLHQHDIHWKIIYAPMVFPSGLLLRTHGDVLTSRS